MKEGAHRALFWLDPRHDTVFPERRSRDRADHGHDDFVPERRHQAAAEPKALWEIADARHEDLYGFAGAQYEEKLVPFLSRYLSAEAQP